MDIDVMQTMLDEHGFSDWTIIDEVSIESPDGDVIEWDGITPDGEESAIRQMGWI